MPYRFIGKDTVIHSTPNNVEVYYHNERIASHIRDHQKGIYVTKPDYLSSQHRFYNEWSPTFFIQRAKNTVIMFEVVLKRSYDPAGIPKLSINEQWGLYSFIKPMVRIFVN